MNVKQKNPQRSYTGIMWRTNRENKKRLINDFEHRCAYCDDLDKYGGGSKVYHVEHFAPKEKFPELKFQYDNLLYACPFCNISNQISGRVIVVLLLLLETRDLLIHVQMNMRSIWGDIRVEKYIIKRH